MRPGPLNSAGAGRADCLKQLGYIRPQVNLRAQRQLLGPRRERGAIEQRSGVGLEVARAEGLLRGPPASGSGGGSGAGRVEGGGSGEKRLR